MHDCRITVINTGNTSSFTARVIVYRQPPLHEWNNVPSLTPAGSVTTSVGALETKRVTISTPFTNPFVNGHLAVAFDPLMDPFPVNRIGEFTWHEQDLLRHDLRLWRQFSHRDNDTYFGNSGLIEVLDKSWTLGPPADHAGKIPANPSISRIYFPGAPPTVSSGSSGVRSELRQDIHLGDLPNGVLAAQEGRSGNLGATVAAELVNFNQSPRDRGTLAIALSQVNGNISPVELVPPRPEAQEHREWTKVSAVVRNGSRFNQVAVRLLAERRTGSNSDTYFGDVACTLKHRQLKRTLAGTFFPPLRFDS
jgi:hypothetical protein